MIDLNKEIKDILKNSYDYVIFRVMSNIKCNCWRKESNTPDPGCPRCYGHGWIFNEFIQKCKLFLIDSQIVSHEQDFSYGKTFTTSLTSYTFINENTRKIKINDIIFSLFVNSDGSIYKPIKRTRKYQITDLLEFREENGKPEFLKILAKPLPI